MKEIIALPIFRPLCHTEPVEVCIGAQRILYGKGLFAILATMIFENIEQAGCLLYKLTLLKELMINNFHVSISYKKL